MDRVSVNKLHTLSGHSDSIYAMTGIDSSSFLSSGSDGQVVMWHLSDPENGRLIAKIPSSVYSLAYDNENNSIVVGQNFEGIHIIDIQAKKEIMSLQLAKTYFFDIKLVNDYIIVAGGDGTVNVIDKKRNIVAQKLQYSNESARCIDIIESRNEMAIGYSDNKIRIIDIETFELKQTIDAHENSVFTVKYHPSGKYLLSGSRDAHFKVWDVSSDYVLRESVVAHMYAINNVDFSPNGKHFVTCSMDKSIKVWDAKSFRLLKVIDKARHAGHGTSVNKLFWSNYNHQLISCSDDRTISIWDLKINDEYEDHAFRN